MANYMIFDEKTINNNFKFQVGKGYKQTVNLLHMKQRKFESFPDLFSRMMLMVT